MEGAVRVGGILRPVRRVARQPRARVAVRRKALVVRAERQTIHERGIHLAPAERPDRFNDRKPYPGRRVRSARPHHNEFCNIAELLLARRRVAVPEVVVAEHEEPAFREMPHERVITANVLRHAVYDVQIPDGFPLRQIDLPPKGVYAVRGRNLVFSHGDCHNSLLLR